MENPESAQTLILLRNFLSLQQRRAEAYAKLRESKSMDQTIVLCNGKPSALTISENRKFDNESSGIAKRELEATFGFAEYMVSRAESIYQQLCSEITVEFSDCSKHVREIESQFLKPDCFRDDLARLLRAVQEQEKQKLHLTATIQVLKKAGRPSDRLVTHENCRFKQPMVHECVHVHELTDAAGTEEAEADAEYDNALKEAIRGVQDAVTSINEILEEVRYEIAALESD